MAEPVLADYDEGVVRARVVVPLVLLCALATATPALALPHPSKAQSRMISDLVERWVNDVIRGQDLADGWKIAGPVERGAIPRKVWLSGRQLPVMQVRVRNNPRTSWYMKWKSGNQIGLVVQLKTGRGKNREILSNETTLQKVHGRWMVNGYYTDGIIRPGAGHYGSCTSSKCQVTGLNDYKAGGPSGGNGGATTAAISGAWATLIIVSIVSLPFAAVLMFVLIALARSRRARRAQLAYTASRTS